MTMPADTPAPSPSQESSALDALLREVDVDVFNDVKPRHRAATAMVNGMYAPRLAAIVRVLRDVANAIDDSARLDDYNYDYVIPFTAVAKLRSALARAEAIAKGE